MRDSGARRADGAVRANIGSDQDGGPRGRMAVTRIGAVVALAGALIAGVSSTAGASVFLPGQFEVSDSGSATYTIPIAVPPGTAGLVPALNLRYDSHSGNGLLGLGWSLGGLPAIVRCPQTIAQDGARAGVNYDANDRFCLEGQRLIAISGSYGADGAEYRTEREGFSKIVSYGTAGTGPAWFKAWTKSGQVMEFGNTADSRIEAQGKTTARLWTLNRIQDTKGNYLTVTYSENSTNGEYRPDRIDYTGNAGAALSPYASVQFAYETRPDIVPMYEAGSLIKTTQRLTSVKAYVGTNLIRDYRLTYETSPVSERSRLTSVTLCDGASNCLPATTFAWQGQLSVPGTQITTAAWGNTITGDWNGDGRTDVIYGATMYHADASGQMVSAGSVALTGTVVGTGDWNADGKTDLVTSSDSPNCYYHPENPYCDPIVTQLRFYRSTGTSMSLAATVSHSGSITTACTFGVGDWNGDGRSDYLAICNGVTIYTNNGNDTFSATGSINFGLSGITSTILRGVGDWNGDGRSDLAFALAGQECNYIGECWPWTATRFYQSTGPSMVQITGGTIGQNQTIVVGDFNGDGRSDYILTGSGSYAYRYTSKGDGTFVVDASYLLSDYAPVDWNGDGKSDLLQTSQGTNYYYVSTGYSLLNIGSGTGAITTGDWNGDGSTDLWRSTGQYKTTFAPELVSSITSGLGAVTSLTYKPLTDASLYSKDTDATYPTLDLQMPIYVVSEVQAANGLGGTYRSTYKYEGAKANLQGRGFLGFRQVTAKDEQTGIEQVSTFRQDHPYIGLVASRVKKLGTTELNRVDNTYTATPLTPGTGRNFVSLQQSVESSRELDGSLVTQVTTAYQYDAYGNATQVAVTSPDGHSKTTVNTYTNDAVNWILGRLTRAEVTSVTPN